MPVDLATLIDPGARKPTLEEAMQGTRNVFFGDTWHGTPVYRRDEMPLDARLTGPAILQQMDTTILIEPGDGMRCDDNGNLLITMGGFA